MIKVFLYKALLADKDGILDAIKKQDFSRMRLAKLLACCLL
jgi:hypothetical protein